MKLPKDMQTEQMREIWKNSRMTSLLNGKKNVEESIEAFDKCSGQTGQQSTR